MPASVFGPKLPLRFLTGWQELLRASLSNFARSWMKLVLKIVAWLAASLALMTFMLAPAAVVRVASGLPLNAEGPSWEIWLLVLGCGLGAGAARLTHWLVLKKGGFSDREIEKNWLGR